MIFGVKMHGSYSPFLQSYNIHDDTDDARKLLITDGLARMLLSPMKQLVNLTYLYS